MDLGEMDVVVKTEEILGCDYNEEHESDFETQLKRAPDLRCSKLKSENSKTGRYEEEAAHLQLTRSYIEENMTVEHRLQLLETNQNIIMYNQKEILKNQTDIQNAQRDLRESHVRALNKIFIILNQIQRKSYKTTEQSTFPIMNLDDMAKINDLCALNFNNYVPIIRALILPEGLLKNMHRLFNRSLIQEMNYDGVSSKKPFKEFKSLNTAIFEAVKKDGYTDKEYIKDIRMAFKNHKNIFYKKTFEERKKQKNKIVTVETKKNTE